MDDSEILQLALAGAEAGMVMEDPKVAALTTSLIRGEVPILYLLLVWFAKSRVCIRSTNQSPSQLQPLYSSLLVYNDSNVATKLRLKAILPSNQPHRIFINNPWHVLITRHPSEIVDLDPLPIDKVTRAQRRTDGLTRLCWSELGCNMATDVAFESLSDLAVCVGGDGGGEDDRIGLCGVDGVVDPGFGVGDQRVVASVDVDVDVALGVVASFGPHGVGEEGCSGRIKRAESDHSGKGEETHTSRMCVDDV